MFFPEGRVRVFLFGRPTDMRKSFDGLYALARQNFDADPLEGHLFVFANRRGSQVKVLFFDRTGWALWAKRLESGSFVRDWSQVKGGELDCTALKLLLEGLEVKQRFKRYSRPPPASPSPSEVRSSAL